jgi:hypothetical protein
VALMVVGHRADKHERVQLHDVGRLCSELDVCHNFCQLITSICITAGASPRSSLFPAPVFSDGVIRLFWVWPCHQLADHSRAASSITERSYIVVNFRVNFIPSICLCGARPVFPCLFRSRQTGLWLLLSAPLLPPAVVARPKTHHFPAPCHYFSLPASPSAFIRPLPPIPRAAFDISCQRGEPAAFATPARLA